MRTHIRRLAELVAAIASSAWGLLAVLVVIVLWVVGWVVLDFAESWHRLFDVTATITMLLLIFGLEVRQNRSNRAIHLKLDELLRSGERARTELVQMEQRSDAELDQLHEEFQLVQRGEEPRPPSGRGP
jgi:low affinity Fe/Cu permease